MDATQITGGTPLGNFLLEIRTLNQESFLAKYPNPFILIETIENEDPSALDGFATLRLAEPNDSSHRHQNMDEFIGKLRHKIPNVAVVTIEKRDSKFQSIITLGRAPKSDILINIPSVSKFHCYFTHNARDNSWHLSDADAANGTYLNGQRLKSNTKVKLEDGYAVRLGSQVLARFFRAEAFHEYLSMLIKTINMNPEG